jgi:oxalate---CoA ligase
MDYPADTVSDLLNRGASSAPAVGAPAHAWMSHDQLRALGRRTVDSLNGMGIGRNDRVAIVLPNGPEAATSFVAIAHGATTAPLNPAYRADEFDFYLSDLNAEALVILDGMECPAREVASKHNIPIVALVPSAQGPTGDFTLKPETPLPATPRQGGLASAEDIALVLHTSGTTSRPKIVPLSQTNITASAYHIGATLDLNANDVCLNISPSFIFTG